MGVGSISVKSLDQILYAMGVRFPRQIEVNQEQDSPLFESLTDRFRTSEEGIMLTLLSIGSYCLK